jgi:Helix-turn-helix domain
MPALEELSRWTRYEDMPERLTVDEFAKAAGLSRASAYDYAKQGIVPTVRFGRRVFVLKTALRSGTEEER